jgi:hypothetical protein
MPRWSRLRSGLALLTIALPVALLLPAAAAAAEHSPLAVTVVTAAPVDLQSVVEGTSDASVVVNAAGTQQVHAFRLTAESTWQSGDPVAPAPPGSTQLQSFQIDPARWLAQEFYNIGERIPLAGRPDSTDITAERAAYQLAIWSFTDGLDLAERADTRVTVRARFLAGMAEKQVPASRRSPVSAPQISLSAARTYSGGTRFEARLHDTGALAPNIEGALLRFVRKEDGDPIRVMATGETGNVELDLPDAPGLTGQFRAEWLTRLTPGTVLSGGGQHLVLFEPLPVEVTSEYVDNPSVSWGQAPVIAFDRVMDKIGWEYPVVALSIGGAFVLGLPTVVAAKVEERRGRRFAQTLLLEVLALGVVCWILFKLEATDFRRAWAQPAEMSEGSPLPRIQWVRESSSLTGENPHSFAGACAIDGSNNSAWLSRRNQGPGEMLAVGFKRPVALTGLRITPGWFDSLDNYEKTAKPQDIEIFSDTGAVKDVTLPETTYQEGPRPLVVNLKQRPLYGRTLYVRVLSIEGDVRTYTAITEIQLRGAAAVPRAHGPSVVRYRAVQPSLTVSKVCGSTDWETGN